MADEFPQARSPSRYSRRRHGMTASALSNSAGAATYTPGSLVRARDREWIVLPGSTAEVLRLRPLSGSEEDVALLHTRLEPDLTPALFPPPTPEPQAGQ